MEAYDPMRAPDPSGWLAMDEGARILAAEEHHRRMRIRMPNHRAHAAIHAVVENQIAEGGEIPTAETLRRLMCEGLDRHEAIHAIGMVLAHHMYKLMKSNSSDDPNLEYFQELKALTAERWRSEQQDADE